MRVCTSAAPSVAAPFACYGFPVHRCGNDSRPVGAGLPHEWSVEEYGRLLEIGGATALQEEMPSTQGHVRPFAQHSHPL